MIFDFPLIVLQETDSTSRYLTSLCEEKIEELEPFTTVLAEYQSAGKGQQGNSWESEVGANLTFSFVLYPNFLHAKQQFAISQVVALGIIQALRKYRVDGFAIKWPNDIYHYDKKICGILIEVYLQGPNLGRCICGIGLNVNQEIFFSDAPNPVSLCQIIGHKVSREELLMEVMGEIKSLYTNLSEGGEKEVADLVDNYYSNLYRRSGYHHYKDKTGEFMAKLLRVEPDGRLVLEDEEQHERSYLFKEIQYII